MTSHGKGDEAVDGVVDCQSDSSRHGKGHGCCQCGERVEGDGRRGSAVSSAELSDGEAVALSSLKKGERGRLFCIDAGRSLCGRLTSMGLAPGMMIDVVRRQGSGEMVICAHRTRLALGRGIVDKIMVQRVASSTGSGAEDHASGRAACG